MRFLAYILLVFVLWGCKAKKELRSNEVIKSLEVKDLTIPGTSSSFDFVPKEYENFPEAPFFLPNVSGPAKIIATPKPDGSFKFEVNTPDTTIEGAIVNSQVETTTTTVSTTEKSGVTETFRQLKYSLIIILFAVALIVIVPRISSKKR